MNAVGLGEGVGTGVKVKVGLGVSVGGALAETAGVGENVAVEVALSEVGGAGCGGVAQLTTSNRAQVTNIHRADCLLILGVVTGKAGQMSLGNRLYLRRPQGDAATRPSGRPRQAMR